MKNKKEIILDDLALMVAKGFEGVDKRFEEAQEDRSEIKKDVSILKQDIKEIKQSMKIVQKDRQTDRNKIVSLEKRVELLEKKRLKV